MHGGAVENAVHLGVGWVYLAWHLVRRPGRVLPFVATIGPHTEITRYHMELSSDSNGTVCAACLRTPIALSVQCVCLVTGV